MVRFIDNYLIVNYKSEPVISNFAIIPIDTVNFKYTAIKRESSTNFTTIINKSNLIHDSNTQGYSFDCKCYFNLIRVKAKKINLLIVIGNCFN